MAIDIVLWGPERHAELTMPLLTSFGLRHDPERAARMQRLPEITQRIAALDGAELAGCAASFELTMTTPGGSAPVAGLTMVGVIPTHRRRGVLTRMIERHFAEARAAGQAVSALWASEGSIYGRFGYGIGSVQAAISIERERAVFRKPIWREGTFRLLSAEAARAAFAPVYDRVRAVTPGMMARSPFWWEYRRIAEYDKSGSPTQHVLLEIDGRAEGYALYKFTQKVEFHPVTETTLGVVEAMATSPRATALLWRYLFDMDLAKRIDATLLWPGHPLFHLVTEARRLYMLLGDALWVRLIDVEAALRQRSWSSRDALTFALRDDVCPWNTGAYRIDGAEGRAGRAAGEAPELRLDASALASLYLGGISASELWAAGQIEELAPGAVHRADALFRSGRAPWCPEIF